jgi:F-type H+-transporting ATPase subunit epsilon
MAGIKLAVISPQKKVLEIECISVTMPTTQGQITVLPKHMAIFSALTAGEVKVKTSNEQEISLAVGGGFVNVNNDQVTLLVEFGVRSDEIDEEKVQEVKRRAEEILKSQADDKGSALAQATLARSLLELKIARRRRKIT